MDSIYLIIISILTIIILCISIKHKKDIKILKRKFKDLTGITSMQTINNVKVPGTKNIIDIIGIHPTGIYLINKINYEGHIRGTLMMDYWEIDTPEGKTYIIKNPVKEMRENEEIIKTMLNEKIYPVIIFKNKTNCYVFDGWINDNLTLIKEYEQENLLKNKEYIISYTRAEDLFENMIQFRSRKKRSDK